MSGLDLQRLLAERSITAGDVVRLRTRATPAVVRVSCERTTDETFEGEWFCAEHPTDPVNPNEARDRHLIERAACRFVWICVRHGPEEER